MVRESYRTKEEALKAVRSYMKRGVTACLISEMPEIGKFVVERGV